MASDLTGPVPVAALPVADLDLARAAATHALADRLARAGCPPELVYGFAQVAAEITIDAAWRDLKRGQRRPTEDGR